MRKKKYSIDQIDDAWTAYRERWCFKYIKDGEKYINHQKPSMEDGPVTKLERVRYSQVMGFPKFLRTIHG